MSDIILMGLTKSGKTSIQRVVFQKMSPVGSWHVFVHELGGSSNGGEGRFEFVSEGLDIFVGMSATFQRFAHVVESIGESIGFAAESDGGL